MQTLMSFANELKQLSLDHKMRDIKDSLRKRAQEGYTFDFLYDRDNSITPDIIEFLQSEGFTVEIEKDLLDSDNEPYDQYHISW